jgi:hypothetical protein
LEVLATGDLLKWHACFGTPGSCNDINVLDRYNILAEIMNGTAPDSSFTLDGVQFDRGYFLVDGNYPPWWVFVTSFSEADTSENQCFAKLQEALRNNVERAFCALQARWHIIARPSRLWFHEDMSTIMSACIILHNMIVEDQRDEPDDCFPASPAAPEIRRSSAITQATERLLQLRDRDVNHLLQTKLV